MIKRSFRRITAFFLLLLLGCASLASPAAATLLAQATPPTRTVSAIEAIRQRDNILLVGVQYDYEPFGFVNTRGEIGGFDVDLARALAERWDAQVEFIPVTASDGIQKLAAGAVDLLAAALTHRPEAESMIDFSQSYFRDQTGLLVQAEANILTLQDLQGKTIAAVRGSSALDQISLYAADNGIDVTILPFQEYAAAKAALQAGQVQALMGGVTYLARAAQANPKLALLEQTFAQETYALGIAQGDSLLRGLVDATLQELKQNGLFDQIYKKWFPEATPYPIELFPGEWPFTLANSPTALDLPANSRFAAITQRGKLIVGIKYDFPPFGFLNAQGQPLGFEVDLARALAQRWLGAPTAVELVPVTDATRIPFLVSGGVDLIIAALPHTHRHEETIDFSQTYFVDEQSLLVKTDSAFQTLADLKGKSVATINGSNASAVIDARSQAERLQLDLLPFQEYPSAFQALKAGQVDAFVASRRALEQFAEENADVRVLAEPLAPEHYAIGLPNFDAELRDQVNLALQALQRGGAYAQMYQQWFEQAPVDTIELWVSASSQAVTSTQPASPAAVALAPTATPTLIAATPTPIPPTRTPRPTATTRAVATNTPTAPATSTPVRVAAATATFTVAATLPTPTATSTVTYTVILEPTATPTEEGRVTATPTPTVVIAEVIDTYQVKSGDTLATIAQSYYQDQGLWPVIYEANKTVIGDNPNILLVGLELVIPAEPQ